MIDRDIILRQLAVLEARRTARAENVQIEVSGRHNFLLKMEVQLLEPIPDLSVADQETIAERLYKVALIMLAEKGVTEPVEPGEAFEQLTQLCGELATKAERGELPPLRMPAIGARDGRKRRRKNHVCEQCGGSGAVGYFGVECLSCRGTGKVIR